MTVKFIFSIMENVTWSAYKLDAYRAAQYDPACPMPWFPQPCVVYPAGVSYMPTWQPMWYSTPYNYAAEFPVPYALPQELVDHHAGHLYVPGARQAPSYTPTQEEQLTEISLPEYELRECCIEDHIPSERQDSRAAVEEWLEKNREFATYTEFGLPSSSSCEY